MLPNLSDKWGASLEVVKPIATEPSYVSKRRNAVLELQEINQLHVSYAGKGLYAVEVFVNTQRDDSASRWQDLGIEYAVNDDRQQQKPTIRVERELHEFKDLRNKAYDCVFSGHNTERCEFCTSILEWGVFGTNPDGVLLPLLGGKRVARKITKLMSDLLECTARYSVADARDCCAGQALVPQAVHEFLFNLAN